MCVSCGDCCHPLSSTGCRLAPFVVRACLGAIIFCTTPGRSLLCGSFCRLCVGRYLLGGGDVGYCSGGGGGGGALVWRRRAERRLADHDVLRASCGSMDWSRAWWEANRHARRGNGFAGRVDFAVVCPAPQKIFVALLNAQQSRPYLDGLRLECSD